MIHTKLFSNLNNERVGMFIRINRPNSQNDRDGNENKMEKNVNDAEVENLLLMDAVS